jgi:apoptosis-inducing factor 3
MAGGTLEGHSLSCPFHGACFDIRSGDIEDGPSFNKIPVLATRTSEEDGFVYVRLGVSASNEVQTAVPPTYATAEPMADSRTFVILGAGATSHAAVEELRSSGFSGRIVIVDPESPAHHYDRTKLSKTLTADASKISLRDAAWWDRQGVELRLGVEATAVDSALRVITLSDESTLTYDKLLCATGGAARTLRPGGPGPALPGADLENVLVCRTLADSHAIHDAVARVSPRGRVVVIGTGFIGMELAATIAGTFHLTSPAEAKVASITLVGREREPLARVVGEEMGAAMRKIHEANGVCFEMESAAVALHPSPRASRRVGVVELEGGKRLDADVVIVGAGIVPCSSYLEHTHGVTIDHGGVVTDEFLVAAPHVFAAGDLAVVPFRGEAVRFEHWNTAIAQGRVAARNMLGKAERLDHVPFFSTGQFGRNIRYSGHASAWDELIVRGDASAPRMVVFMGYRGKVVAVATLQSDPEAVAARELFRASKMPSMDEIRGSGAFSCVARLKE